MDDITFSFLKNPASIDFEAFFDIYQSSIDKREQKNKVEVAQMISRPDYRFLLMWKSEIIVGFSIAYLNKTHKIALLEYMAIKDSCRNLGLGGVLFSKTFQGLATEGEFHFGIIEVDTPPLLHESQNIKLRRVGFYQRHGCIKIEGLNYILPLPGEGQPPAMNLMLYPMDTQESISKDTLQIWLQEIYKNVYGCAANDNRIAKMMNAISKTINLQKSETVFPIKTAKGF